MRSVPELWNCFRLNSGWTRVAIYDMINGLPPVRSIRSVCCVADVRFFRRKADDKRR